MINRDNYLDVKDYLRFQADFKQNDPNTIKSYWFRLVHMLKWAQETSLTRAAVIKPTLPAYLEKVKSPYGIGQLGAAEFTAICKTARAFFLWAKAEHPGRFRMVDQNWIASIRPPRMRRESATLKERELYTLDEVIHLATCPVETLCQQRTQAAAALLFLSGMRIGAFASLPIGCVDLDSMRIYQLPERGVMTKNRKAAITTLLNIPELMAVARAWDVRVRKEVGEGQCWFTHLTRFGELSTEKPDQAALLNRKHGFADDLRELCTFAGIVYKSAHKFRHGHAVYALKQCTTMEEFKSVSQNLMHSNMGITDGIYGKLVDDDVHNTIQGLTTKTKAPAGEDLQAMFEEMVRKYTKGKE